MTGRIRIIVVALGIAVLAMAWDHGDKHPRAFTYTAVPFETYEIGHSGTYASLSGDERHRFEADQVSVIVAKDRRAYLGMRVRQYGFTIVHELDPVLLNVDWMNVWVRVPPGSSPDAAVLIASIAGVREAMPSPVLTTNVVASPQAESPEARRR